REAQQYLPYTEGNSGIYKEDALTQQAAFYGTSEGWDTGKKQMQTAYPYAETIYEKSPLSRVQEQSHVGATWRYNAADPQRKTRKTSYRTNLANEVRYWYYDLVKDTITSPQYYTADQLQVILTEDEAQHKTWVFQNTAGKTVYTKTELSDTEYLETYFVYDVLGRLRLKIPPKAVDLIKTNWELSQEVLAAYCYQYSYDARDRMTAKKVPSAAPHYYVYNHRGQVVLAQTPTQRPENLWTFHKYDRYERAILTGLYTSTLSRDSLQRLAEVPAAYWYEARNNSADYHQYTNRAFPVFTQPLNSDLAGSDGRPIATVVQYYDDYQFGGLAGIAEASTYFTASLQTARQGMLTGIFTRSVATNGWAQSTWLVDLFAYDEYGRLLQSRTTRKDFIETQQNQYDFEGKLLETQLTHIQTAHEDTVQIREVHRYFANGSLHKIEQSINEAPLQELLAFQYNEQGQEVRKTIGGGLQQVDYRYNARGWLTHMNDAALSSEQDLFGMELHYNEVADLPHPNATAQYNGNLAGMRWKSRLSADASTPYSYAYQYDRLNRLTEATLVQPHAPNNFDTYFERGLTYDKNGNLLTLQRGGLASGESDTYQTIDDLTYTYAGNQLLNVVDATATNIGENDFKDHNKAATSGLDDYAYYADGSLQQDRNKGIVAITYNYLGLPSQWLLSEDGQDRIENIYDAQGRRLRQVIWEDGQQSREITYVSRFLYEDDRLIFFHTPTGRAVAQYLPEQPAFRQEYHLSDHLGNLRVAFSEGSQENTMATLDADDNEGGFRDIATTRTSGGYMNTHASRTQQSVGVWKTLAVSKGDTLQLGAVAHYASQASENRSTQLSPILSNTGNTNSGEGDSPAPDWVLGISITPASQQAEEGLPQAALQAVLYDASGQNILAERQQAITTDAYQAWETLALTWVVPENGIVQVSVVNTSDTEVLFDNITLQQTSALIVQENHYYAFGGPLTGLGKTGTHRFLYQGKELQTHFDLQWYDFHARQYDWQLGRWWRSDPQDQFASPYLAMANNPMMMVDPDGELVGAVAAVAFFSGVTSSVVYAITSGENFDSGDFWESVGVSALSSLVSFGVGEAAAALKLGGIGQNIARNILSHNSGALAASIAAGRKVDGAFFWSNIASGAIGGAIPDYSAISKFGVVNIVSEAAYQTLKGGFMGGLGSIIAGGDVAQGMRSGAYNAAIQTGAKIVLLGYAIKLPEGERYTAIEAEEQTPALYEDIVNEKRNKRIGNIGKVGVYKPVYRMRG
ncbi:MAG: RHS repeat-associated core domain-containing protein, partial [Bacteroidota bacterium]